MLFRSREVQGALRYQHDEERLNCEHSHGARLGNARGRRLRGSDGVHAASIAPARQRGIRRNPYSGSSTSAVSRPRAAVSGHSKGSKAVRLGPRVDLVRGLRSYVCFGRQSGREYWLVGELAMRTAADPSSFST